MEETQPQEYTYPEIVIPPPPPPITLDDLLTSMEVVRKKEQDDKLLLESIGNISFTQLKEKLVLWAVAGFPNVYEIHRVSVIPPQACSDGVTRSLGDYILFCSGKNIHEHVGILQEKVTSDIIVTFANMGAYISIVVSKA